VNERDRERDDAERRKRSDDDAHETDGLGLDGAVTEEVPSVLDEDEGAGSDFVGPITLRDAGDPGRSADPDTSHTEEIPMTFEALGPAADELGSEADPLSSSLEEFAKSNHADDDDAAADADAAADDDERRSAPPLHKGVGFREFVQQEGYQVGDEDAEEVLVLLPDDQGDSGPFSGHDDELAAFGGDQNAASSFGAAWDDEDQASIVDAKLRTVNPRAEGADELDAGEHDFGLDDDEGVDSVGVLDEIAALATSLDEDILNAAETDSAADGTAEGSEFRFEDYSELDGEAGPRRRSRFGLLAGVGSLAALAIAGVFYYDDLMSFFSDDAGSAHPSVAVAAAPGQGAGSTAAQGGGVAGGEGAPGDQAFGGSSGTTDEDELGTGSRPGSAMTRVIVKQKVLQAFQLGIQWGSEESTK
jgi:hypothetical protein